MLLDVLWLFESAHPACMFFIGAASSFAMSELSRHYIESSRLGSPRSITYFYYNKCCTTTVLTWHEQSCVFFRWKNCRTSRESEVKLYMVNWMAKGEERECTTWERGIWHGSQHFIGYVNNAFLFCKELLFIFMKYISGRVKWNVHTLYGVIKVKTMWYDE